MLKHLSLAEMAALGLAWVEKGARRDTFLSIPEIAPLHPSFIDAHTAILAVQPADKTMSPELRKVTDEGNTLDVRHDLLLRAGNLGLELARTLALAAAPPDTARADTCDRVLQKLYPDGLSAMNTSWLAEAGNTARIAQLLEQEPDIRPFLKTIHVPGKTTLLDVVDRWLAAGDGLRKIELKREELTGEGPADKATIQAARSRWIRIVSVILTNLEVSTAPAEAIETIRGPVLRAAARAGKRYPTTTPETPAAEPAAQPAETEAPAPA